MQRYPDMQQLVIGDQTRLRLVTLLVINDTNLKPILGGNCTSKIHLRTVNLQNMSQTRRNFHSAPLAVKMVDLIKSSLHVGRLLKITKLQVSSPG